MKLAATFLALAAAASAISHGTVDSSGLTRRTVVAEESFFKGLGLKSGGGSGPFSRGGSSDGSSSSSGQPASRGLLSKLREKGRPKELTPVAACQGTCQAVMLRTMDHWKMMAKTISPQRLRMEKASTTHEFDVCTEKCKASKGRSQKTTFP